MPGLMPFPQGVEVRSAVEQITVFAASARAEHLRSDIRQPLKLNILDCLGCAIAGLQGKPFHELRERFEEYRAPALHADRGRQEVWRIKRHSLTQAWCATYMAIGGLCHPSDNFGSILAAAEEVEASGEEFMLALAVAKEIQWRRS